MACIEKISHQCGSSDGLQVFEEKGEYTGYCFSCATYVPDPYQDKPKDYKPQAIGKTEVEKDAEIQEVLTYPYVGLPGRELKDEYLERFEVKVGLSETDGRTPSSAHFIYRKDGEIVRIKHRILSPKKMWSTSVSKIVDLFTSSL